MKSFKTFLSEKSKAPQMKDGYKGKEQVADIKQLLGGIGNQHQNGQIKSALKKAEKSNR